MITIILGALISAIIAWKITEWFPKIASVIIWGTIGACIGVIVALIMGTPIPCEYELEDQFELRKLEDSIETSGNFFLGCGSFDGVDYYRFYKIHKDGARTLGKLPANNQVKIYEEERTNGIMKVFKTKPIMKDHLGLFRFSISTCGGKIKYEFHIPNGSIDNDFKLDLN